MPSNRIDRLRAADNLFLAAEDNLENFYGSPGFAFVFQGDPPSLNELRKRAAQCVEQIPRLRQIVRTPPLRLGRPVWVTDPSFNLSDHVHAVGLTADDRSEMALQELIETLFAQRISRNRPMWQLWLVTGLHDGRFAILFRTHHALGDGVVFAQHFTRVLLESKPGEGRPCQTRPQATPEPARARELTIGWLLERVASVLALPSLLRSAGRVGKVRQRVTAVIELAKMIFASVPAIPDLNPSLSAYRRVRWLRFPLADLMTVRAAYDCKVNDVFMAMVAGALREWLTRRGVDLTETDAEVGMPVSLAAVDSLSDLGNHMSGLRVALPTSLEHPEDRLIATRDRIGATKGSAQPLATLLVTSLEERLPAALLPATARLHTTSGLFNMFASNIAGPERPLYLLGRELRDIFPINLLMGDYAFVQTMVSYHGQVCLCVVGNGSDGAAVEEMVNALERAREQLLELVRTPPSNGVLGTAVG